jgi:penicillin-binding protein 1A
VVKKPSKSRKLSVYSNLAHKRRVKKDAAARKKAEYLATLPKQPLLRMLYRLHPKRVLKFWFSKHGLFLGLKLTGIGVLLGVVMVGGVFAYYRKDLDTIRPGELAKRVQTTVTRYEDRNGTLLWEDKGDGNYTMAVESDQIAKHMKEATIAIEDKDFYKHSGISLTGIARAVINNLKGGSTQGASTLTQQLVKQVFFEPDEAQKRDLSGIPRKIKEMVLAVEVERMYDKDQILTLYLNESSYGGRRNGVESGAKTYFDKDAKDLTLAESAMLAAIPNAPGLYDPYNTAGNEALLARQHKVLDNMAAQGYITQNEADEAKKVAIIDTIKPVADQYKDIKAPHFVQMVRAQLESELGKATVGRGGLIVKTTLDLSIQNKLEEAMAEMFASSTPAHIGFTNGAATVEDVKTGQIVALMGSRDFNYPGFGQDNAALAFIQPGSTIKPLVYAQLFQNQGEGKANYGSGSILADDKGMDAIYGAPVKNADGGYKGNINIRSALSMSRNIPAIKAMYISGKDPTWETIRSLGDTSYCTEGPDALAGLSSAIGGCGTRPVDHTNAMASLARMGTYKPWSTILEVKNSGGNIIKKFTDESKPAIDPQAAYIVNDILGDANARRRSGLYIGSGTGTPYSDAIGLKIALKTGTSDKGGKPKDLWSVGYTPNLAMSTWLGNPDTSELNFGYSYIPAGIVDKVMAAASQMYQDSSRGAISDWFTKPNEVQVIKGELYPSWYNQQQAQAGEDMTFDKVSKKKATDCTPEAAKVVIKVTKMTDPITNKAVYINTEGYDANAEDDVHLCSDAKPVVNGISVSHLGGKTYKITVNVSNGRYTIKDVVLQINGTTVTTLPSGGPYTSVQQFSDDSTKRITATATDEGYYSHTYSINYTPDD